MTDTPTALIALSALLVMIAATPPAAAQATAPATQPAAAQLSVRADAPDALIVGDAPTTVTVTVKATAPEHAGEYELRQQFVDRYWKTTDGPTLKIALADQWQQQVNVPVEHFGPASYKATLVKVGTDKPIAQVEQFLIRPVPVPRLAAEQRLNSPIGINVHTKAHWDTLAKMGIHWARDYSWGWLGHGEAWPKAKNGVDFTDVQPAAERAGITILPVVQQAFRTPDKKFHITDAGVIVPAFKRLSDAAPQLPYWELDNEVDLQHRDENSDDYKRWFASYLEYIRHADRGLKEAGHGARVVLNGEAGIRLERTRELIEKVGEHFAVVNYHFYTGTVAPELAREDINTGAENRPRTTSFLDQMRQINRLAHDAGKQAWLTEIGWSARSGPAVGDRLQSAYLERVYLLARWAGTDKTFWFWDRELPPGGRFSSTELVHDKEGARPAGAAMAAVSKFTALAEYAGSVDVGEDRWCLVFKRPEGGYVVAAWAVQYEHDLPAPLAAVARGDAFDMYGNPLRDRRLTAEPAYFHLLALPKGWQEQLPVEWVSPTIINVYQGADADVEVRLPGGGQLAWDRLPRGAEVGPWEERGERRVARIAATSLLDRGTYPIAVDAKGDGWQKRFELTLRVRPAVHVEATPYTPGQPNEIELTNLLPTPLGATLSAEHGAVEPSTLTLRTEASAKATFTGPADATAPVTLDVKLSNGATQRYLIRPNTLTVPRAARDLAIDGDLSDWPLGGDLPPGALKLDGPDETFAPRMKLAWSPAGLYVGAIIPVGPDFTPPSKPDDFWEWTSVEMNFSAEDVSREAPATQPTDATKSHLLWFTPTKDTGADAWRVYAGEWLKPMPDEKKQTMKDDDRTRRAARYDGQSMTIEVLVPPEVTGAAPQGGQTWPLTITSKIAKALSPRTVAAWPGKKGQDTGGRGRITFSE
jgi:hypothetical protein